MAATTPHGRGTALSTPWASPLAVVKHQSGEAGTAVARLKRTDDERKPDPPQRSRLRIGTVNVGSMCRRSREVVEMIARRRLDFCCLQETRWKGGSAKIIGSEGYKFFWMGCKEGTAGIGVVIAKRWVDKVIEVKRVSERVMVVRVAVGKSVLNLISVYAPQVGRSMEEKEEFWTLLGSVIGGINARESLVLCGDMNGHVGAKSHGFEGVHGGMGYGNRNVEGEMLLEFADAKELVITNTCFTKDDARKVSYESAGNKTVVDYILVRRSDRGMVLNVNVIQSEECIPQHKLLVCVVKLTQKCRKQRKPFVSKCKIWKLKQPEVREAFCAKLQLKADESVNSEVERIWSGLRNGLSEAADAVCGRTKGPPRHRETWWWNDNIGEIVKEKRRLFKVWKNTECESDKKLYTEAKRQAKKEINMAQEVERKKFGEMLVREDGKKNVFRVAKQMVSVNKDVVGTGCIKDKEGNIVTEDAKILEVWKMHYDKLLNEEFDWNRKRVASENANAKVIGPAEIITVEEVRAAMHKMKSGKAAGPTGIVAEMLLAGGEAAITWMTDLCNVIIKEGSIPADWKRSWIVNVYKGKGDALECGSYRGIKLLEQVMKVYERVLENRVRQKVDINAFQFGFRSGCGTTDAIFIVRQLQERYLEKKKELWMAFVDLEKAFDRVPREVVWWALRELGVDEWLVNAIMATYTGVTTAVRLNGMESTDFEVKVGVHQGSVLSPLLFIVVLEALSRTFRVGLPWELLYADDLVLIAETEEKLLDMLKRWKDGMESKGLRVNMGKTKVMKCQYRSGQVENSGKYPCGVCRKGVGKNSVLCTGCKKWIHNKCSGVKGALKDHAGFVCRHCIDGTVENTVVKKEIALGQEGKFEIVDKFCYLGDMIGSGGEAEEASRTRVRCAWSKFNELSSILTVRGASLRLKGKIYRACVQSVLMYGSETWPMKVDDLNRLERTERMMVRWMCGVSLKDRRSSVDLYQSLGIENVAEVVRRGRLRWFGHVERKDKEDWVSACRYLVVEGTRPRGRGKKKWSECNDEDLRSLGLNRKDAQDRVFWKSCTSGNRLTRARMEKQTQNR